MKKIYFLISAMLVMAACTSEDLFIDESNTTESVLTRSALSNEYLDIKTTKFVFYLHIPANGRSVKRLWIYSLKPKNNEEFLPVRTDMWI